MEWALCGSSALCAIREEDSFDNEHQQQAQRETQHTTSKVNNTTKNSKEFEADYASSCTTLYTKLEHGQWAAVVTFLESGYWPDNLFYADPISPSQQVRTWVTRRNDDHHDDDAVFENNGKTIRWSQLPLQ
jgi:hypothetical protein